MSNQELDIDKVKPLDDIPSKEDELKGKSHDKVAKALVKLISRNEGGYAIGLEGSWGSGKSSVVRISEELFKKDEYLVYTFDAWAHQGDPIRRSFLECLFGFLKENKIVSIRDWSVQLRKIKAQEKRIISESKPKIPGFNYVMVIYGLILPFLIIWANDHYEEGVLKTLLYPASVIVGIPILAALFTKGYRKYFGREEFKDLPILPSTRYLIQKNRTEQFVHTVDATTIEFNRYFDDLLNRIKNKNKKLIVVVDNLDRLSVENVKAMWGTMRNFFTSEHWGERYELLKSVYLVVPYDYSYISEVFSETDSNNDSNRSTSGFIDKTFKYTFQVSSPILTDWRSYFYEKVDKAFDKQLDDKQKYDLYKLFEFKFQTVTPRSIKKYINELVVQVMEWGNEIPIKYLALYALHKDDISIYHRDFSENNLIDRRSINYLEGENWLKYLVAAYHKVKPDDALQIVIGRVFNEALINENFTEIENYQQFDWFESALNLVIEDKCKDWASGEPITYSLVAKTISKIEIENSHIANNIWNDLAINTKLLGQIKKPNYRIAEGFSAILEKAPKSKIDKIADKVYGNIHPTIEDDSDLNNYTKDYSEYIFSIFNSLDKRLGSKQALKFLRKIRLPNRAMFNVLFAAKVSSKEGIKLENFDIPINSDGFNKELKNLITAENVNKELFPAIEELLGTGLEINWNGISQDIFNRFNNNKPALDSSDIEILLLILSLLDSNSKGEAGEKLNQLSNNGVLIALIERLKENSIATTLIILHILRHYQSIDGISANTKVPVYGNNNSGLALLKQICTKPDDNNQIVENMAFYGCKFSYSQYIIDGVTPNKSAYPLIEQVALKLIEKECIEGVNILDLLKNLKPLQFIFDNDKGQEFFALIDRQKFDVNSISNLGNISIHSLENLIDNGTDLGNNLVEKVKDDLSDLDAEDWLPILEGEEHQLELMLLLIEKEIDSFLSEDFNQALLNISGKILDEDFTLQKFQKKWRLLPKALAPNTRATFYERLFENLIIKWRDKGVFRLLSLFDDEFLKTANVEKEAQKFIKNVVSGLVNSDEIPKLAWVEENIQLVSKCYKKSGKKTQNYLIEIIEGKQKENPKVKEKILAIANGLGIDDLNWKDGNDAENSESKDD